MKPPAISSAASPAHAHGPIFSEAHFVIPPTAMTGAAGTITDAWKRDSPILTAIPANTASTPCFSLSTPSGPKSVWLPVSRMQGDSSAPARRQGNRPGRDCPHQAQADQAAAARAGASPPGCTAAGFRPPTTGPSPVGAPDGPRSRYARLPPRAGSADAVAVDGLSRRYGPVQAVREVSFTAPAGGVP